MMQHVGVFLLLIATGLCSANWFRINSTCFHVDKQTVNHNTAISLCQEKGAVLHSIQSYEEMQALKPFLFHNWFAVSAKRTASGFKWGDGRDCCPNSWWRPISTDQANCALLNIDIPTDVRLWPASCEADYKFICSKPVGKWTLVKFEEYYWPDLCGVGIMPNCDGRSCEEVCDSHPNCKQFAKISNLCINIKNDAPLNECVIKMRSNVELYERMSCK